MSETKLTLGEKTPEEEILRVDTDYVDPFTRRIYEQAGAITFIGNLALLGAKGVVAYASGSSAIYADAANSASDVAYSILMIIGLWVALRPPDESHPHGHRRFEPLVSVLIGLMMALAGVQAARTGFFAWREGPEPITSTWAYLIPVITVIIKGGMYLRVRHIAESVDSTALAASARDNLSDVVASGMALVGVVGSRLLFAEADPLAAFAVSLWILRAAWDVLHLAVRQLTGGAAPPELTQAVIDAVRSVPDIDDVHQVIIEYVGPQVRADIHINMSGDASLDETHRVSDEVRAAVEALREVDHAFVHVEPSSLDDEDSRVEIE